MCSKDVTGADEHDRGKPCHYYTTNAPLRGLPRESVYSSDRACPCHATSHHAHTTAGIILAGGRSVRMGRDKALLPLPDKQDVTFVEHLAAVLAAQCSEVVLVVRDAAQATLYKHLGVSIVADDTPDVGPLMGLYTGLHNINAPYALVAAVDMPFVQAEMVAFLLSQPLDGSLLVPIVNDIPQVLFAVYPRTILPLIEERLQAGRRDPRSLLDVAPVRYIDEVQLRAIDPQLRSFVNMNTPEDYSPLSTSI